MKIKEDQIDQDLNLQENIDIIDENPEFLVYELWEKDIVYYENIEENYDYTEIQD